MFHLRVFWFWLGWFDGDAAGKVAADGAGGSIQMEDRADDGEIDHHARDIDRGCE